MHSYQSALMPKAPFDFARSLQFLAGFPATVHEQTITEDRLIKALRIDGEMIVFALTSTGNTESPELELSLWAENALDEALRDKVHQRVRFFLSMDEDLSPFYDLARQDADFYEKAVQPLYGYHQVKFLTPFELACWSILAQRQPMAQSRQIKQKLIDAYSTSLEFEDKMYSAFPTVEDLLPAHAEALGAMIGNERKTAYLMAVIRAFATVDEAFLLDAPYDEVKAWLLAIKGIGEWSATFILLRGLGRMDQALMSNENDTLNQSMLRAARPVYGAVDFARLQQISARYGEWEGYWAHYLKARGD